MENKGGGGVQFGEMVVNTHKKNPTTIDISLGPTIDMVFFSDNLRLLYFKRIFLF